LDDFLTSGKWTILTFISPSCGPCRDLLPLIRRWQEEYQSFVNLVVISKGPEAEIRKRIQAYQPQFLLLEGDTKLSETYQASWTPAAVVINPQGKIASPVRVGNDAIRAMVDQTLTLAASNGAGPAFLPEISLGTSLFKLGHPAPRFSLPDLQGQIVSFERFLGRPHVFLFWAASCPHCREMSAQFDEWPTQASGQAPDLVILASGEIPEIQAALAKYKILTLLDTEFQIGPLYGITGAPSGLLIDAEGKIASSVASGARHVLALAQVPYREAKTPQAVASLQK